MHLFDVFPELKPYYKPKPLTKERRKLFESWNKQVEDIEAEALAFLQ